MSNRMQRKPYSIHGHSATEFADTLEEAEQKARHMSQLQRSRVVVVCEKGKPEPVQLWVRGVKQG